MIIASIWEDWLIKNMTKTVEKMVACFIDEAIIAAPSNKRNHMHLERKDQNQGLYLNEN